MYIAPLVPVDYWALFRRDWTAKVLKGDATAVLHMKEAATHLGRDPEWDERFGAALDTIKQHTRLRVFAAVDAAAFETYRAKWARRMPHVQSDTAYTFCVMDCIQQAVKRLSSVGLENEWITYFFERGHKNWGQLRTALDKIRDNPELRDLARLYDYLSQTKQERMELQAVDLGAYWVREIAEVAAHQAKPLGPHPLMAHLVEHVYPYNYYDAERLAKMLDDYEQVEHEARQEFWRSHLQRGRETRGNA